eukprot:36152-Eustigmatos_ZCMA.PRE.1
MNICCASIGNCYTSTVPVWDFPNPDDTRLALSVLYALHSTVEWVLIKLDYSLMTWTMVMLISCECPQCITRS